MGGIPFSMLPQSVAGFSKVAPYLTHPLVLIGFVLLLAYGLYQTLFRGNLLERVRSRESARIIRLVVHYAFILALALIMLGFGLEYRSQSAPSKDPQQISQDSTPKLPNFKVRFEQRDSEVNMNKGKWLNLWLENQAAPVINTKVDCSAWVRAIYWDTKASPEFPEVKPDIGAYINLDCGSDDGPGYDPNKVEFLGASSRSR